MKKWKKNLLAASVLLILIVNFSAMYHFDRKGKHRRKKRR